MEVVIHPQVQGPIKPSTPLQWTRDSTNGPEIAPRHYSYQRRKKNSHKLSTIVVYHKIQTSCLTYIKFAPRIITMFDLVTIIHTLRIHAQCHA